MSKLKVLSIFKKLHKTAQFVFNEDTAGLAAARKAINDEFRKHISVQEPDKIEELLTVANDAEVALRSVIQAEETKPGVFRVRITEDHLRDNPKPTKKKERRRKRSEESPS